MAEPRYADGVGVAVRATSVELGKRVEKAMADARAEGEREGVAEPEIERRVLAAADAVLKAT